MKIYALAPALALLAACTQTPETCVLTDDPATRATVITALRPLIEYEHSDGYVNTMETELQSRDLSVEDCGKTYRASFTIHQRNSPDGVRIGNDSVYVIAKSTGKVLSETHE
ncbi:hypothetical protein [Shimia sp. Alg240-R146]|uniref:hypothetical protein n=1 Tax=Shimia sp. Alg240-R146 TaxID=2993449 RepID=UPI0022E2B18D|nr:hypothetical protein [Shimia sp. Alg240-R146]